MEQFFPYPKQPNVKFAYIYIYIERERERDSHRSVTTPLNSVLMNGYLVYYIDKHLKSYHGAWVEGKETIMRCDTFGWNGDV